MPSKKISTFDDEIDIRLILKKWWIYRKFVFFGTVIVALLAFFILIFSNNVIQNARLSYVTSVVKNDYQNNSRVIAAYKSESNVKKVLKKLSINIDTLKLLENISFINSSDPFALTLKNQLLSLGEKDLKNLALSNDALSEIMNNLNDVSDDLITIKLYHNKLNLTEDQSTSLILELSEIVNMDLINSTTRDDKTVKFIDINDLNFFISEYDKLARLLNIVDTVRGNLSLMNEKYRAVIKNYDLEKLLIIANITQKLLYEYSSKIGNSITEDSLRIKINQKERDINDLKSSLEFLNIQKIDGFNQKNQENDLNETSSTTQLDGAVFDKILSIGSEINLNELRVVTVKKIQELQKEKSKLISQQDLLDLPPVSNLSYSLDNLEERVKKLVEMTNEVTNQINELTESPKIIEIIKNPELFDSNSKTINEYVNNVMILSILAFFIISFISILIPARR